MLIPEHRIIALVAYGSGKRMQWYGYRNPRGIADQNKKL